MTLLQIATILIFIFTLKLLSERKSNLTINEWKNFVNKTINRRFDIKFAKRQNKKKNSCFAVRKKSRIKFYNLFVIMLFVSKKFFERLQTPSLNSLLFDLYLSIMKSSLIFCFVINSFFSTLSR